MDSALCLHYGALNIPPTTSCASGLARAYSSFRPSSLSFTPKTSTHRPLSQHTLRSSPVICALNNPSPPSPNYYKENCKKVATLVGGASVVLACVLGVINCNCTFNPTALAWSRDGYHTQSSSTQDVEEPLALTSPKLALDSLLKMNRPLDPQGWFTSTPKLDLPPTPSPKDREELKTGVARLIQSGKCDEAERQLNNLYIKVNGGEPGRDVQMELVLVLIFQGKYEDALKCECLNEPTGIFSDTRVQLYKAIIHTMLDQDNDAIECWNKFVSSFATQESRKKATSEAITPIQPRKMR